MDPAGQVLITSLDDLSSLAQLAAALSQGSLVGLGSAGQVRAARRECAAFDNVMFVTGSRDDIPWRTGWFTLILDADPLLPTPEMLRVLAPNGSICPANTLNQ